MYNFCTVDLSSFYLDILKDRLYTHGTRSLTRRSAQTVLWHILDSFTRLMAPILPFTMEEVWKAMHEGKDKIESVHVEMFPVYQEKYDLAGGLEEWDQIISVREMVSKALEELRHSAFRRSGCLRTKRRMPRQCHSVRRVRNRRSVPGDKGAGNASRFLKHRNFSARAGLGPFLLQQMSTLFAGFFHQKTHFRMARRDVGRDPEFFERIRSGRTDGRYRHPPKLGKNGIF